MLRDCWGCALALVFLGSLFLGSMHGADGGNGGGTNWAYFRGPSGQGYCDDTRVPLTWNENENVLWKTALPGKGNSSPIVWGERIFLTAAGKDGDERYVFCVRTGDGKVLWQRTVASGVPSSWAAAAAMPSSWLRCCWRARLSSVAVSALESCRASSAIRLP